MQRTIQELLASLGKMQRSILSFAYLRREDGRLQNLRDKSMAKYLLDCCPPGNGGSFALRRAENAIVSESGASILKACSEGHVNGHRKIIEPLGDPIIRIT